MASFRGIALFLAAEVVLGTERSALFWLVPYGNLTSVADYEQAWHQYRDNYRPGYLVAGSAYAAKVNGSLGYAVTSSGEGEHGILMERFGFPAAKNLGLKTLAMVYVTHYDAIKAVLANSDAFIQQLVDKAADVGLDGFDIDYEPQGELLGSEASTLTVSFMEFLGKMAAKLKQHKLLLTIDIGDCPTFFDFVCSDACDLPGLLQVNTMSTFGSRSVINFKAHEGNKKQLHEKWAPGFEPGNAGEQAYRSMLQYMLETNVTTMSTWQVHESNVGDQPQWLFDAVNAFLDSSSPEALFI